MEKKFVIGLDFGSDSGRAIVVDATNGETIATSVKYYPRWMKGLYSNSFENRYRQHPLDYIDVVESIIKDSLAQCPAGTAEKVVGLAFDTTGSTPIFTDEKAVPLSLKPEFAENPNAMFILWKDHTAWKESEEINELCTSGEVPNYTEFGKYTPEWLWAKVLHVFRTDEQVRNAAYGCLELCDWLPAMLAGIDDINKVPRSRCAIGHKGMWNAKWGGLPPVEFFTRLDPLLTDFVSRASSDTVTVDQPVGKLCKEWADRLGLSTDVAIGSSAFDCHIGAIGAGIKPGTLVRIIGTSTCDVLVSTYEELGDRVMKGICGQVDGSILPGMIGLEAGQSSFGDVYAWFRRIMEWPLRNLSGLEGEALEKACDKIIIELTKQAEAIPAGESGLIAMDWFNGRRSPDADALVKGAITGLTLGTSAPMIYRALVEATAYGSRAIVDCFKNEGATINEVIGVGGIALKSPFVMQTMANVMNMPIKVCSTDQACALGAAMCAAYIAGVYPSIYAAQQAMCSPFSGVYEPQPEQVAIYEELYKKYLNLGAFCESIKK